MHKWIAAADLSVEQTSINQIWDFEMCRQQFSMLD